MYKYVIFISNDGGYEIWPQGWWCVGWWLGERVLWIIRVTGSTKDCLVGTSSAELVSSVTEKAVYTAGLYCSQQKTYAGLNDAWIDTDCLQFFWESGACIRLSLQVWL